ncbi:ABC transporter substrate-binding protein [Nonomuraea ferruginea]|uniref:ABC transporter substrate-binding protein n=1 Tax=Nonomuraea ferruginea TaxID=46174 RepID=A0ABT4SVF9_9ACTN|nr:ABC transporter substrate-binding protein [Nonomuraea ferruginea]MDA0641167.1 ABC transporter substrate-binding protein [Nonomuraea ferruginea]
MNEAIIGRRRFLAMAGLLTAGSLAVTACGTSGTPAPAASRGPKPTKLAFGVTSISDYLNPLYTTSSRVHWITDPVVESLYTHDASLKSVPLLADGEPEISDDGLTWTIKLKEGVTFANGDPFTAADVVAALKFVSDPKSTSDWTVFFAGYVKDAEADGDHTVKITLTARYGVLRAHLTNLPIIHKDFVAKTDTTMGTGPFTIEKVTQGQSVELSRNDSYHGDKPALASVVFQAVPDPATRLVNLREGKIHIMTDVTPESVALLKQDAQVKVHEVDAPSDIITYFTANKAPFDDVKVRQALAYAMDRKGVRDVAYAGTATIAQGPIGPAVEGHDPSLQIYGEAPDHEKAKALLAEAGASDLKFTLTITSDAMMKNIGQVLVEGWKQAGITCTLETLDVGPWVQKWASGKFDLVMNSFETGFGAGRTAFSLLNVTNSAYPLNFGYKNEEVDKLLGQAWAADDEAERAELCKRINGLLAADAIIIPPVYPKMLVAQRTDVSPLDEPGMSVSRISVPAVQFT